MFWHFCNFDHVGHFCMFAFPKCGKQVVIDIDKIGAKIHGQITVIRYRLMSIDTHKYREIQVDIDCQRWIKIDTDRYGQIQIDTNTGMWILFEIDRYGQIQIDTNRYGQRYRYRYTGRYRLIQIQRHIGYTDTGRYRQMLLDTKDMDRYGQVQTNIGRYK